MTFSLVVCRGIVAQSGCLRDVNYSVRDSRYAAACAVAVTFRCLFAEVELRKADA